MAVKTVFEDNNGNEMECYLNDKGLMFLSIGQKDTDRAHEWGFITLNKDDVANLMKILKEAEPHLAEEHPAVET